MTFKVDAFPEGDIPGRREPDSNERHNGANVVTYNTIIEFANPELKLFPGMTAYVTIPVDTVRDAMKASQYRPPLQSSHDARRDPGRIQAIRHRGNRPRTAHR